MTTSFNVNINDLQYILKQIKIAEASSAAYSATPKTILQAIMDAYGITAVNAAQLPAGLRTVDGTFNGLLPGMSEAGAADNLFPRLTDPVFRNVDGPGIDFNGDGLIDVVNHNYGDASAAPGTQIKSVADVDPRLISNLIVDMTPSNPAAIDSFVNNPLSMDYIATYLADHSLPPVAPADVAAWLADPANVVVATDIMKTIPNQSPDIGLSPGFNAWMTFFGQFFDHGLDLVTKGKNGTVYVPLTADDPLYDKGADGIANNVVDAYFVSDPASAPAGTTPAVSGVVTAWQAFYQNDPAGWPVGAPPPPMTATNTGFLVKFNDDGAGADGRFATADDRPNFMALTRATATIDANGIPQTENTTTSWIDQNQTYTSHASHQVFLREYARIGTLTVSTGRLLDGNPATGSLNGAIGNWGDVKAQSKAMLGLTMNDFNVHDAPLLKTDQYGKFIAGTNGFAQVAVSVSIVDTLTGATVTTLSPTFIEGVSGGLDINALTSANLPGSYVLPALGANQAFKVATIGTGHAFLNDIAHHAAPGMYDADGDGFKESQQVADTDPGVGDDGLASTYDDEMLNAHFATGDGRGNENIALTSVHSIFHSEHNRLVEVNKTTLLANAAAGGATELGFLNEWLLVDVTSVPTDPAGIAALVWDGERLFQAARFGTEMQYQHLVFEEFARRVQPAVDPFIFNSSPNIDPSIVAEFAHTVYRFGHSMLTGTVDRLDNNLDPVNGTSDQASLLAAFLNPQMYLASGSTVEAINANLIRALSRDVGNAIDEFIVPDVRSSLLGLPLDLAALNIARGRETGIPSLNETRKQLYEGSDPQPADLKPYASWADFGANLTNPASLVNFVAAYGTHASITAATTLAGKRTAASDLVQGAVNVTLLGSTAAADVDAYNFLHALGTYAGGSLGGLNDVDLWIGGLAEAHPEFGGMLGTTFNYIFEFQMEQLQFGDRMYYLTRTQGLNILNNLEPNTFSDLVMRNTALGDVYSTHLNGALFVTPDYILELDRKIAQENYGPREYNGTDPGSDPTWGVGEVHSALVPNKVIRNYTGTTQDVNGHDVGGTIRFTGGEHVVIGGTEGNDKLYSDRGIDTIWGDGGNDYINAGTESDDVFGGEGDDIIEDPFGDDVLRGNQGNDVISEARGADLVFGDEGQDYLILGQDASEAFGGEGNDFILGGGGKDFLLGNEGDDWIEGGAGFDTIAGDNSELFFNSSIIGHDVLFHGADEGDYDAESGDDIMGSGPSVFRYEGMFGFDWGIAKNDITGVNFDLQIPIFTTIPNDVLRDRFDQVEGLSGWKYTDHLDGDDRGHKGGGSSAPDSIPVELFADHLLTQEGINRISGFQQWFGGYNGTTDLTDVRNTLFGGFSGVPGSTPITTYRDGNILMGGDGGDFLRGRGGYDLIDGDTWLNVRIKIVIPAGQPNAGTYSAESMSTDTVLSGEYAGKVFNTDANGNPIFTSPAFGGATLNSLMLNGTINPGNMSIVRELLTDTTNNGDIDTAIFQGEFWEYQIEGSVDINGDGDYDDQYEFGVKRDLNGDGLYTAPGEDTTARDVNGDGFISVRDRDTGAVGASHNSVAGSSSRGNLTDDTDFLKNIEQLQFADGIKTIAGGNNLATGVVTIHDPTMYQGLVTPYVGQVLTASLTGVQDPDGVPVDANGTPTVPYTFEWQTTEVGNNSGWSTIQTSLTYTVRSVDPGHILRAVAVFNDNLGHAERILSANTDNPTAAYNVNENSFYGTVVAPRIPFSIDYDPTSFNGNPPPDVDLTTLYHEIDPANDAGDRFKIIRVDGVDFQGTPLYQIIVNHGGPNLDYEFQDAFQIVDNQYQVVVNSYTDNPANGGVLVAVRQFTIFLNDVNPENPFVLPSLDLNAFNVTSTNGQYLDNFNTAALNNSNGTTPWAATPWVETGDNDGTNSATLGQIRIGGGGLLNNLRFTDADNDVGLGTATIQRTVNLAGVTSATISYSFAEIGFDAGELVTVTFSDDGSFSAGHIQTIQVLDQNSNFGNTTNVALTGAFTANAAIRFVVSGTNNSGGIITDTIAIDNLTINTVTTAQTPGSPGNDYATTFTENGAAVAIASLPDITSMDTIIQSAKIVLTDWQAGDVMSILGALPAGITAAPITNVAGVMTLNLSGDASLAAYETAIGQVRFANTTDVPGDNQRIIQSTVTDVVGTSAVATTTVTVIAVDDPGNANGERVITNMANNVQIVIPEWVFLANDTDPDSVLDITAVTPNTGGLTASLATNSGSVTLVQTANNPNTKQFTYTIQGDTQQVNLQRDQVGTINGQDDNLPDIIVADGLSSTIDAGTGNDYVFAGGGDDIIQWNVTNAGVTDGRDFVDGQANGATGDRFVITGNNTAETFNIYTTAAAGTAGIAVLNAGTEIVITRNGTVIAELDNIEEITINTLDTTAQNGDGIVNGGVNSGDTINVFGNFNAPNTSLNFNTITVNGSTGNDKVDIAGLASDHRVVLNTGGGRDAIVGGTRPQDIINVTDPTAAGPGTAAGNETNDDDIYTGTRGRDIIDTGAGSDLLRGLAGRDQLHGGAGQDWVVGGKGVDELWGGADNDTFVFSSNSHTGVGAGHRDVIKDFASGDVIDVSGYKGTFKFLGESALTNGSQNQVSIVFKGGNTIVQIDNDNSDDVDAEIELVGIHHLEARDFAL